MLRAKYLDWCSARIAARFVELTPDEIYELAQRPSSKKPGGSRDVASASADAADTDVAGPIESFRQIVERVTEVLAANMNLPAFSEWSAAYQAHPSRYDDELLGLWRQGRAE